MLRARDFGLRRAAHTRMTCINAAFNRAENAFDNLYVLCSQPPEIQPHGVIIVSVSWPGLDARKKLDSEALA